jgi:hypothetical protein
MRARTGAGVRNLCEDVQSAPWATPTNEDGESSGWRPGKPMEAQSLNAQITKAEPWPTPAAGTPNDGESRETWQRRADALKEKGINGNGAGMPLAIAVQPWPTPTVQDGENDAGPSQFDRNTLPLNAEVIREAGGPWSTPQTSDRKKGLSFRESRRSDDLPDEVLRAGKPGLLNPDWVETLCGLPIGWTRSDGPSLVDALKPNGSRPE